MRSEQPLITLGWSWKSGAALTMPKSLTIRSTRSRSPSSFSMAPSRTRPVRAGVPVRLFQAHVQTDLALARPPPGSSGPWPERNRRPSLDHARQEVADRGGGHRAARGPTHASVDGFTLNGKHPFLMWVSPAGPLVRDALTSRRSSALNRVCPGPGKEACMASGLFGAMANCELSSLVNQIGLNVN